MNIQLGDLIEIAWVDSFAEDGWMAAESAATATPVGFCRTAGYVLAINDDWLTITSSWSKMGSVFGFISIPTRAITSTTVLVEHAMG